MFDKDTTTTKMGCAVAALILLALASSSKKKEPTERHSSGPSEAGVAPSGWQLGTGISPMDDSPTVTLSLPSQELLSGPVKTTRPELVARCAENKTTLYIHTGLPLATEYGRYYQSRVRLRIDQRQPETEFWLESSDFSAIYAPGAIPLLRKLADARSLRVEVTAFRGRSQVLTFNVKGLDFHLGRLASTCGWSV
jgi:type VI secretion system protein VasI